MSETLEHVFNWTALTLPAVYYAALVLKKGFGRAALGAARNVRGYLLIFEYSFMLFFFGGMVGTLILYYPRLSTSLTSYGLDPEQLLTSTGIEVGEANLRRVRGCLWGLGGWFLSLGVAAAACGRREVFPDVRDALKYYVHKRRTLQAAAYVSTSGARPMPVWEIFDPAKADDWTVTVNLVHEKLLELNRVFRASRQGVNVRVALEIRDRNLHFWRFGAHCYLVAEIQGGAAAPLWRRYLIPSRTTGEREFRALASSIRSIASIHGA